MSFWVSLTENSPFTVAPLGKYYEKEKKPPSTFLFYYDRTPVIALKTSQKITLPRIWSRVSRSNHCAVH